MGGELREVIVNDYIVSLIRTWVPVAVGGALTWLASRTGIVLDENTSAMAATVAVALVTTAYYTAARSLEQKWPRLGRALLTLGLTKAPAPAYHPTKRPAR
jgi:hypothetical protein